jgi:hypothetical protein
MGFLFLEKMTKQDLRVRPEKVRTLVSLSTQRLLIKQVRKAKARKPRFQDFFRANV